MTKRSAPLAGPLERASTGVEGLDDILGGGFPRDRVYLVRGNPGVGKTTLALQFLIEGARNGERVLYITLSETEAEIRQVADSHGWSLDNIGLFELSSAEQTLRLIDENTLYAAEDVDLKETMRVLLDQVEASKPQRVVFDSLSEIRLLAQSAVRYRRQILALKQHFVGRNCTALMLDDHANGADDRQVESLAHGVLELEQRPAGYGGDRRRLRVVKLRGSPFRSGHHDFVLETGGLRVFPRLIAAEHRTELRAEPIDSGVPNLDAMLGGGIDRATATLLVGPAGTGKSALGTQFALAATRRGEHAAIFLFEERIGTWLRRGEQLGMPLKQEMEAGRLRVYQVDPAQLAPDELTHLVRSAVEGHGAKVVVVDSITGYFNAMPEAHFLSLQMHELLSYLSERGVASVLTMTQAGLIGANMASPIDISYLADTILLFRYFETAGRVRKAISVLKRRAGSHQDSIRELSFDGGAITVGAALERMTGVLSGLPGPTTWGRDLEARDD